MVCKKACLSALLIVVLFLGGVLIYPFYAYAATDGVLVADNSISYFGNLYMVPGQTLTQRVSFNFSCNNANSGAIGGVFDFTLKFPPPQQYISFNILDAYVVIGSERHEVAFDIMETAVDGSFKYQFWSRFVTKNISVYSYARLVVEIQLACGAEAKATVDDDRTQRFAGAGESAYSITFDPSGHATTETNYARLFIKHKFLGGDDDYFNGVTTSTTNFSGVKLNVPYRVTPDHYITSTGDMYVRTENIYLPHLRVELLNYSGSLNVGSVDYQVDDDRTHELLEELIREGGTNADAGTHNRLDAMQQQQQQAAADQLEESKKQTAIAEEQAETTKGIFGKIADFFGSFFDKVIDTVKHLIIPTAEELTAFLQEVNDWFGARLGFVWYPFSLAVDLVSALAQGSADQQLTVPAFRFSVAGTEYTIWEAQTVDLDTLDIFKYVRFFTSALLAAGVVRMAVNKWDEWIGGHVG